MKLRKLFIVSGIVGSVGLIISMIALLIVGFNFERLDLDMEYTTKTYTVSANEISGINVNTSEMKVTVCYRKDESNEVKITYYENEKRKPTIENDNGIITLNDTESTTKQIINGLFGLDGVMHGFKRSRLTTVIELPKDCNNLKLFVKTSNATINAKDIYVDSLDLELITSNAAISVSGEISGDVRCETSNAAINIEKLIAENVTFSTSNGNCNIGNIKCRSIEAYTSNASIECENINSDSVHFETSNGRIETGDITAKDSFYADTSNSGIKIQSVESDNIELYSSNGGINATVVGNDKDYTIESGTSNGNDNLYGRGDNTKNKSLKVFTSNSNINVDFTK